MRLRSLRSTEPRKSPSARAATTKLRLGVETKQRLFEKACSRTRSTAAASVMASNGKPSTLTTLRWKSGPRVGPEADAPDAPSVS